MSSVSKIIKKTSKGHGKIRVYFFASLFLLLALGIAYHLFFIAYYNHAAYAQDAKNQQQIPSALLEGRGSISLFDMSAGKPLLVAANDRSFYVYTNPKQSVFSLDAVTKLAGALGMDVKDLTPILADKTKSYVIIDKDLTSSQADAVQKLKISGINLAAQVDRQYLHSTTLGQVLGYVGYDGYDRVGQYGVESYYDDILNGSNRTQSISGNDTYASLVKEISALAGKNQTDPGSTTSEGEDLVLNIDPNIQQYISSVLNDLIHKWSATSGTIIVQDPKSGGIFGMISSPGFDPNNYAGTPIDTFQNPATQKIFEPGSSFKMITMAAGIDSGLLLPTTTYDDNGPVQIGTYTVKNATDVRYGTVTMTQVLEHSLNTGAIFAENKTGNDNFLKYVVSFGFGQKSGVDLAGEILGNIGNLYKGRQINFATASFGQGVTVTPVQLINAYSAVANGGKLMKPFVVKAIRRRDGTVINQKSEIIDAPISADSAKTLSLMLNSVVDNALPQAQVSGYELAAKTGTAQIPDPKGGYESADNVIHNIVGFGPLPLPKFTLLIKLDKPKGVKFSAESLSPAFAQISRFLLRYLNVAPSKS